jgi:iron only hydrogenase large subunit-like protein
VDVSAKLARERAINHGIAESDIGVFFISPCPAKVYALKANKIIQQNYVDGVLSVAEVYMALMPIISKLQESKNLSEMGVLGLQWASSGGEAAGVMCEKYLAADGIENVIDILERLENGTMTDVEFVELNACIGGCVGGVLNVENPFVAKARIRQLRKKFPSIGNTLQEIDKPLEFYLVEHQLGTDGQSFDNDRQVAFEKLLEIQRLYQTLPHLDCGACGAPSCRAFCEDIVMGRVPADTVCPMAKGKKQ